MLKRSALILGAGVLLLCGCRPAGSPPAEAAGPPKPVFSPAVSINAVMVGLVDHASHELWNVEQAQGRPASAADWLELEHHAIQLAAAGSLVAFGGTGPADAGWANLTPWKKYAREMSDAGLSALTAVRARDLTGLVHANGRLAEACEACHAEFKPELPTEGMLHPHR